MRAEAQLRVARVALLAGDAEAAVEASRHAVEAFRQQRRTGWAARSAVVGVEARTRRAGTATHADLLEVRRAAATLERLGHDRPGGRRAPDRRPHGDPARPRRLGGGELRACPRAGPRLLGADPAAGPARRRLRGRRCGASPPWPCATAAKDWPTSTGTAASSRRPSCACSPRPTASSSASWRSATLRGTSSPVKVFDWMERNRATALLSVQRAGVDGFVEEFEQLREMTGRHRSRRRCVRGARRPTCCPRATTPSPDLGDDRRARTRRTRRIPTRELQALLGDRVLVRVRRPRRRGAGSRRHGQPGRGGERRPGGERAPGARPARLLAPHACCAAPDTRRSQAGPARPRAGWPPAPDPGRAARPAARPGDGRRARRRPAERPVVGPGRTRRCP